MKLLIDTNILIDWLGKREPYFENALKVVDICGRDDVHACVAAHSITNLMYILRKGLTNEKKHELYEGIAGFTDIIAIDRNKIENSVYNDDFDDFEDCLQMECAKEYNADYIVTRNIKDFTFSTVKAITPEELIDLF